MRGYCGIGIYHPKHETNVGTLWRSALALNADYIFTIGPRYKKQSSDTVKTWRHIPLWSFTDLKDFVDHLPYDAQLIGIEITDDAVPLERFRHPQRAVYLLGAEDHGLPGSVLERCRHVVRFTSDRCINVASAGTVVLYDRQAKQMEGAC
jgi:tRNA G18 (ribose-2'-O)-methylase SpoU